MDSADKNGRGVMEKLSIDEALRGVGLELLMKAEELIYATGHLDEEGCGELGSDIYLLASVLSAVLQQTDGRFLKLEITLPPNVGAIRVKNPYYDRKSESPKPKGSGQSDDSVGDFPF